MRQPQRIQRDIIHRTLTLLSLLALPQLAAGHGSDKPGPHDGSVRMPGAFHVEAVHNHDTLHVYLLNIQITDPTVVNSSVIATVERDGNAIELDCKKDHERHRFACPLSNDVDLDTGTLSIEAKRGDTPPATARYELPLD